MKFSLSAYKSKVKNLMSQIGEKRLKNVSIIVLIAIILLLCTYVFQSFLGTNIYISNSNKVSDWAFINGITSQQLTAENAVFKQATSDNPVLIDSSKPYVHLYYTFEASDNQRYLVINANHSPIKAEIDSKTVYNNGYGTEEIVGNNYNEIIIPASSSSQTIHIYMYTPFNFKFSPTVNYGNNSINFQMILAFTVLAIGIIYMIIAVSFRKGGIIKMVLLGSSSFVCGFLLLINSLENSSDILNQSVWFNISVALNMIVTLVSIVNLLIMLSYSNNQIKAMCISIPVLAILAIFIPFGFFFKLIMLLFLAVQVVLTVLILFKLQSEEKRFEKGVMLLGVACSYLFVLNIFNTFATISGSVIVAQSVFIYGMIILNFMLAFYYIKHIAINNILQVSKQSEIDYLTDFYGQISSLVAKLYSKITNEEFITCFCKDVVPIIKSNNEVIIEPDKPIVYANAVKEDDCYKIIENTSSQEPDFNLLEKSFENKPCIIGSNYIGVNFKTNESNAVIGYISNIKIPFESAFKNYFYSLCSSAQAAFENHGLRFELFSIEEKMFINLSRIVEERSEETSNHLINVSVMVEILCKHLGYSDEESKMIATAAMTHDIGKIAISDTILNKKGIYTDAEREAMKKHTVYGHYILSVSKGKFFEIASKIAEQHHEDYDGSGYMHIKGENINKYARIVRVVDTFDALISKRCYKDAWDINEAIDYIISNSGKIFDPQVVKAFKVCADEMVKARQ